MRRLAVALMVLVSVPATAAEWNWGLPGFVPPPLVPIDNPMSVEKVDLGRRLFHDPRLSGGGNVSCASCHVQSLAFSDGRVRSPGALGELTPRNAPGLFNVAWFATYTWANPALTTLERQAEVPLFGDDPVEMGVNDANAAQVLGRLRADPEMAALFTAAFPQASEPVGFSTITKALAAYQRSLISVDSRADRGELNSAEQRGRALFFATDSRCGDCHGGFAFTDHVRGGTPRFHDAAVHGVEDTAYPNRGVMELTGRAEDRTLFRAPSLRHVGQTAPYMHDGRYATLEEVVEHARTRSFTKDEIRDLAAYLRALGD